MTVNHAGVSNSTTAGLRRCRHADICDSVYFEGSALFGTQHNRSNLSIEIAVASNLDVNLMRVIPSSLRFDTRKHFDHHLNKSMMLSREVCNGVDRMLILGIDFCHAAIHKNDSALNDLVSEACAYSIQ